MELLAWFIFDVLFSGALEVLFDLTDRLNTDRALRSAAFLWVILLGFLGGLFTGIVLPTPVLSPGLFFGVSLLLMPAALACLMAAWGHLRADRNKRVSHVATWYGGAALGLGLATGRLVVLEFIREMKAL